MPVHSLNKSSDTSAILETLNELADPEKARFKELKFAIPAGNSLGIYQADLNAIVKAIGKNSGRALDLYNSGVYEARILCGKTFQYNDLTMQLARKWIGDFENWEICDTFSMKLFAQSILSLNIINEYVDSEREFEKRTAFATIAGYCMADKKAENGVFRSFFAHILDQAPDDRNFVKKAISWALRSIGKRNPDLQQDAIKVSKDLLKMDAKSARWIGKDALNELTKEGVRISNYPRVDYTK